MTGVPDLVRRASLDFSTGVLLVWGEFARTTLFPEVLNPGCCMVFQPCIRSICDRSERMLSSKLNHKLDKPLGPLVRWLARLGVSPNMLTVAGAIMNIAAAATLLFGHFRVGSALVIAGGLCDLLDGALARVTGMQSRFGNVLDSTLDRYSDMLPLFGLLLYYSGWRSGGTRFSDMVLCSIVIVGSFLVPYVRAKAESLSTQCNVGLAERAERIIILAGGLMIGAEVVALWVLAVLTHVTVIHRLLHVRSQVAGRFESSAPSEPHDAEFAIHDTKGEL